MNLGISVNNLYYFLDDTLWKIQLISSFKKEWINSIELSDSHWYIYSNDEISALSEFENVTVHLHKMDSSDSKRMRYIKDTLPSFKHFVVHPDLVNFKNLPDKDLYPFISFENMDIRKEKYKNADAMYWLFKRVPECKFTLDINHALENNLNPVSFLKFDNLAQLHFSAVNSLEKNNYEKLLPWIDTTHSMVCLDKWFKFNGKIIPKDTIITLEGLFVPDRLDLISKEIKAVKKIFNK